MIALFYNSFTAVNTLIVGDARLNLKAVPLFVLILLIRAEQASVTLACKEYYPDVEVFGRYDSFWQPTETQSDLRVGRWA